MSHEANAQNFPNEINEMNGMKEKCANCISTFD